MLILDTNIIIAHFAGERAVTEQIESLRIAGVSLGISTITECELFSYQTITKLETERIKQFLKDYLIIFVFDSNLASIASDVRRTNPRVKLPDAAIAATTLHNNASLATRNTKDFKGIENLDIISF